MRRYPTVLGPLGAYGIDTCCRGNESLATAAASIGRSFVQGAYMFAWNLWRTIGTEADRRARLTAMTERVRAVGA